MIRSRLGKSKRLAAFLCALLLTLETVAFPITQAKAAATAALATVGFGVTTAAFLAACGIYPYWVDDSSAVNFDWEDWVDDDLTAVVNEYNAANSTTPINPNQISAFLSGATLLVGNYAWEKLCDFAEWIKTKYAVTDNQTGVELGAWVGKFPPVPVLQGTSPTRNDLLVGGLVVGTYSALPLYIATNSSDVFFAYCYERSSPDVPIVVLMSRGSFASFYGYSPSGSSSAEFMIAQGTVASGYSAGSALVDSDMLAGVPVYRFTDAHTAQFMALQDFMGNADTSFQGITADTSTVSIPDVLLEGTEYGGLRVSGLPAATTAESVIDAIQDSVGERLKTPVEVVDVEIAPGTEVDSETGAITQNPVVIEAPVQETIPALSALTPSQGFLSAMTEALQTKFPFCLPFDFMRVLQAFVKSPDAPVITMTFNDRIGGGTYTVTVDLEPWDDIAAIVRRLESMILFLGFWLNFDRFNVLNIILGQIG